MLTKKIVMCQNALCNEQRTSVSPIMDLRFLFARHGRTLMGESPEYASDREGQAEKGDPE